MVARYAIWLVRCKKVKGSRIARILRCVILTVAVFSVAAEYTRDPPEEKQPCELK
jgi:hypothetical protein